MKLSKMLLGTLREVSADVELDSHKLMLKSGMIKKSISGIYSYMNLGIRAKKNIEKELQHVMEKIDAQEIELPILVSDEVENSCICYLQEDKPFKFLDQNKRSFFIGTNYEDVLTGIIKNEIKSYKQLPQVVYTMQKGFKDYLKPKNGVVKSKEFTELNCYGFHRNESDANTYCNETITNLQNIFNKFGLKIGKTESSEFVVKNINGDDLMVCCDKCGYLENNNIATCRIDKDLNTQEKPIKKVATPDIKTIEQLCEFFDVPAGYFVKTIIYIINDKTVAVMVRGNREVNEDKVKSKFQTINKFELADEETVRECTSADIGFAGPVGIKCDILFVDEEITVMKNFMTGANETGYHYENANYGRDFGGNIGDFKKVKDGDLCVKCGEKLQIKNSLSIGAVSNIGTIYAEKMGAYFLNDEGVSTPLTITKCVVNVDKLLAAIIENNKDDNGIVWPNNIAPYKVEIVIAVLKDEKQKTIAEEIYNKLKSNGIDVLLDDRDERAGVKFKDADLIGSPIRITVGKKINEGKVELKLRNNSELEVIDVDDIYSIIDKKLNK